MSQNGSWKNEDILGIYYQNQQWNSPQTLVKNHFIQKIVLICMQALFFFSQKSTYLHASALLERALVHKWALFEKIKSAHLYTSTLFFFYAR